MPVCNANNLELQLRFCHQYELLELENKLVDECCVRVSPSGNLYDALFGGFSPEDLIRIGETYHQQKLVEKGIELFDIKLKSWQKLIEYIQSSKNEVVQGKLMSRSLKAQESLINFISEYKKDTSCRSHTFSDFYAKFAEKYRKIYNSSYE